MLNAQYITGCGMIFPRITSAVNQRSRFLSRPRLTRHARLTGGLNSRNMRASSRKNSDVQWRLETPGTKP